MAQAAKIITVFNEKGGAGKTTTACQLAGTFGHHGYDVLVADLDAQNASSKWLGAMQGENFPGTLWTGHQYGERTSSEIEKLSKKFDLIFIDCPPSVEATSTWSSLLVSDLALIPTKLNPTDINALHASLALAKKALLEAGRDYPVRIVPTAYKKTRTAQKIALEQIAKNKAFPEFSLIGVELNDRAAFENSPAYGATAHSMPGAKLAIEEIERLANAVAKILGISLDKE